MLFRSFIGLDEEISQDKEKTKNDKKYFFINLILQNKYKTKRILGIVLKVNFNLKIY